MNNSKLKPFWNRQMAEFYGIRFENAWILVKSAKNIGQSWSKSLHFTEIALFQQKSGYFFNMYLRSPSCATFFH